MQIIVLETCDSGELGGVCDDELASANLHNPFEPQLPQHAVDVYRGQTQSVGQDDLRQRKCQLVL